jgi:hypothetical protein
MFVFLVLQVRGHCVPYQGTRGLYPSQSDLRHRGHLAGCPSVWTTNCYLQPAPPAPPRRTGENI